MQVRYRAAPPPEWVAKVRFQQSQTNLSNFTLKKENGSLTTVGLGKILLFKEKKKNTLEEEAEHSIFGFYVIDGMEK